MHPGDDPGDNTVDDPGDDPGDKTGGDPVNDPWGVGWYRGETGYSFTMPCFIAYLIRSAVVQRPSFSRILAL